MWLITLVFITVGILIKKAHVFFVNMAEVGGMDTFFILISCGRGEPSIFWFEPKFIYYCDSEYQYVDILTNVY